MRDSAVEGTKVGSLLAGLTGFATRVGWALDCTPTGPGTVADWPPVVNGPVVEVAPKDKYIETNKKEHMLYSNKLRIRVLKKSYKNTWCV